MGDLIRIGMDTSKSVFQLHGVDGRRCSRGKDLMGPGFRRDDELG